MSDRCLQCGNSMKPEQRFCPRCGVGIGVAATVETEPDSMECPVCGTGYGTAQRFCKVDGAELTANSGTGAWRWSAPDVGGWIRRTAPDAATMQQWRVTIAAFIARSGILLGLTIAVAIVAFVAGPELLVLMLPLGAAWIVALSRSDTVVASIGRLDEWFLRSYDEARNGGRFRRWVIRPFYWLADNWNAFSSRALDPYMFAALRLLGYITTSLAAIAAVLAIAYVAVVIAITIALIALALFILGAMLDVDTPNRSGTGRVFGGVDPLMGGGNRSRNIHRGKGGWFGTEEKAGRIDEDGTIYSGKGGWFGTEEKIGRIDEDGNVYEGQGGWFGTEQKVGRRDEDGTIYEGEGGWFGTEEKIGRRDPDGTIYRGKGGWFGHEEKVGRDEE